MVQNLNTNTIKWIESNNSIEGNGGQYLINKERDEYTVLKPFKIGPYQSLNKAAAFCEKHADRNKQVATS